MHAVTPEVQKGQIPSAPWSQSCLFPFVRVGARCRSSPCLPWPLVSAITKLTPGHAGDAKSSPVLRTDARRGIRTCLASPLAPQAWTASAVDLVPTFLLSLCSFQAESSTIRLLFSAAPGLAQLLTAAHRIYLFSLGS